MVLEVSCGDDHSGSALLTPAREGGLILPLVAGVSCIQNKTVKLLV